MACDPPSCVCKRKSGEPTPDPMLPAAWASDWNMYRVFHDFEKNPPPYSDPPKTLTASDYEVSKGTTYYDSTYSAGADGEGAMMEYYKSRCLPIFPGSNQYTCAFVSLGNNAYFFGFKSAPDTPDLATTEYFCFFSPKNHPPRRDFITHLPYNADDSARVPDIQGYSLLTPAGANKPPILFGYAFEKNSRADAGGAPYQHPFAFYFSGYVGTDEAGKITDAAPDAPYVSQNYVGFHEEKAGAFADLWAKVDAYRQKNKPPDCTLFDTGYPPLNPPALGAENGGKRREGGRSWNNVAH